MYKRQRVLLEWSYKTKKGYPDINSQEDIALFESMFGFNIKEEITTQFEQVNRKSYYYVKKSIRKILRNTKKNIRYSKNKQTEVELILFFCKILKDFSPSITKSIPLTNIFEREIQRIKKIILTLDPDLQYDYGIEIDDLQCNK